MDNEFGRQLKMWRKRLAVSQQDFCLNADISTKHLSYLETGKSQPSIQMVEKIAACLKLSPLDRSMLIHAAGFDSDRLLEQQHQEIKHALQQICDRHEPYPGIIADIHLKPLHITQGTVNLLQWLGLDLAAFPSSLELIFSEHGLRQFMPEWQLSVEQSFRLMKAQLPSLGKDSKISKSLQGLLREPALETIWDECSQSYGAILPMVPFKIAKDEQTLNLTLLISTFGLPKHIQLSEHEYQINAFYPNDEFTKNFLEALEENVLSHR